MGGGGGGGGGGGALSRSYALSAPAGQDVYHSYATHAVSLVGMGGGGGGGSS